MGLFSRKKYYDQSKLDIKTNPGPIKRLPPTIDDAQMAQVATAIDYSLEEYDKKNSIILKGLQEKQNQILANQQRIMEELAAIRRTYQTLENAAAPRYTSYPQR